MAISRQAADSCTRCEHRRRSIRRNGHIRELSRKEGHGLLDRQARRYLGMSGEAFVKAWRAGEFVSKIEQPEVIRVAMLLPFGR